MCDRCGAEGKEIHEKLVWLARVHTFDAAAFDEIVTAFNELRDENKELRDENKELRKMIHIKGRDLEVNFYSLYD